MATEKHIAIIGAGVLGLTTALELSKQGYRVTVMARELPGDDGIDYASPKAGAHFRPTPVNDEQDAFENTLMRETYDAMDRLAKTDKSAGVGFVPAVEYFDAELTPKDLEMFSAWPEFRVFDASELPKSDTIKAGLTYSAWVLNSPVYLAWLQKQAESRGAVFIRERLTAIEEASFIAAKHDPSLPLPLAVINASGMGFGDPACFPSRGQFILVSNEYDRTISHHSADGHATVIIPRPLGGGTIVGGTREPHNWSPHNSPAAIDEILRRVAALCPDLPLPLPGTPDSKPALHTEKAYIGRRPMRKGGLRLETEMVDLVEPGKKGLQTETRKLPVVHCYGAGPSGYKIGWGAAKRVCEMVNAL